MTYTFHLFLGVIHFAVLVAAAAYCAINLQKSPKAAALALAAVIIMLFNSALSLLTSHLIQANLVHHLSNVVYEIISLLGTVGGTVAIGLVFAAVFVDRDRKQQQARQEVPPPPPPTTGSFQR